ncbi:MAG: hypothetical protein ACYDEC_14310 [Bacteroidia bacterium]
MSKLQTSVKKKRNVLMDAENIIHPKEFEENRSTKIRMKPQPLKIKKKHEKER